MDRGLRKEEDKIKEDKEYEPIQTITMKTFQSKIYKTDKNWPRIDDEPRVQEKQQV